MNLWSRGDYRWQVLGFIRWEDRYEGGVGKWALCGSGQGGIWAKGRVSCGDIGSGLGMGFR